MHTQLAYTLAEVTMSTEENEVQAQLARLSEAWKTYSVTAGDPARGLEHLHATWRCNRALEALSSTGLHLWQDILWNSKQGQFVILDKSTTI